MSAAASPPRLGLKDAIQGSKQLPSRLAFYGTAGIGKTSWAAQSPSPFFILSPGETGLHTLIDQGLCKPVPNIEVGDWTTLLGIIDELATTDHGYKTLVLDTLDGFEKVCNEHVCREFFGGDMSEKGFIGFYRGYKIVSEGPWKELLAALDRLREAKRMPIIALCHATLGKGGNAFGPDYQRYLPSIYKDAWDLAFAWFDIVLFGYREVAVLEKQKGKAGIGKSNDERIILTEWSAGADAKNRHNLPSEILMGNTAREGWDNFMAAVKAGKQQAQETK